MHRAANLFERIPERDNLRLAFHKAARGRRGQAVIREFASRLDEHIAAMSAAISEGTFPVGRFRQFVIRDPKQRVGAWTCTAGGWVVARATTLGRSFLRELNSLRRNARDPRLSARHCKGACGR
jgi:hypothetical protein